MYVYFIKYTYIYNIHIYIQHTYIQHTGSHMNKLLTNPIHSSILAKYTAGGWHAHIAPIGSINDIIAHHDAVYHFIQIYEEGNARHEQLAQNTFIQNAFSNGALPIYATVTMSGKKPGIIKIKVSLVDVNRRSRIIIKKTKTPPPATLPSTTDKRVYKKKVTTKV